jgi:type II secretory pathway pseudopilin PulG
MNPWKRRRLQSGFTYIVALFLVATLSVISLQAVERSLTKDRRDKEAQLLYVGQAYRQAILTYYENSPGTAKAYPPDLQSLLQDSRTTTLQRPLRRLYWDPMTASSTWGIVPGPSGGIMGVYSLSTQQPIKIAGFPVALTGFTGATSYQQWQFTYQPILPAQPVQSTQ